MYKNEYFASPVYHEDKPEWVNNFNRLCDPYIVEARKDLEKSNTERLKLGYKNDIGMTYHSGPLEADSNFNEFHSYVAKKSRWVLEDMGYDMSHYNLIFTESWVQEFSFNGAGHHWFHTHSNSHISGFSLFMISFPCSSNSSLLFHPSTSTNSGATASTC